MRWVDLGANLLSVSIKGLFGSSRRSPFHYPSAAGGSTIFLSNLRLYSQQQSRTSVKLKMKTKIAVCQMNCTQDKKKNLSVAEGFLKSAKEKDAKMIFFPEAFDFIGESKKETIDNAEPLDGFIMSRYKELAKENGMWISLGGFHEKSGETKPDGTYWITNDHILINPTGELSAVYKKIHLFDVEIPEQEIYLKESSYVKGGDKLVLSESTPVGKIGLGVCYDVRFPEFAITYRHQGADVLTYPSAFTVHTGKAHWDILMRARAIESQCFVVSAAQCGEHNKKRASYGHSIVIDPWGTVLAEADGVTPGVIFAEVDLVSLGEMRKKMPIEQHRISGISSALSSIVNERGEESANGPGQRTTDVKHSLGSGELFVPSTVPGNTVFMFGPIQAKYEIVFLENRYARAFVNKKCVVPGHVIVSTKRVVKRFRDMNPEEVTDLFLMAQKVEQIMEDVHKVGSSTITIQDGKAAGQTVEHIHCHVMPRQALDFTENDTIYKELATHDKGPNVQWRSEQEMKEECDLLRAHVLKNFSNILINRNN